MMSKSQPARSGVMQTQPIVITAIVLFALAGLMVGFTVGAFTRPSANNANNNTLPIVQQTKPTPTSIPSPTPPPDIPLGCPTINLSSTTNADGTITYTTTLQAEDKTGYANGQCAINQEKPITADGITCRIWLVPQQSTKGVHFDGNDLLKHVDQFNQQQFPDEVQNAFVFTPPTTTEAVPCTQGSARWKFTVAPTVHAGNYYLVGLTDWQGKYYNWSWNYITVTK